MKLISEIQIKNFRSLRSVTLQALNEYSPLIGINSTGKSNILRALNLFFNDYLDEERTELSMERDYPRTLAKSRQRKLVSVGVVFNLESGYMPRDAGTFIASQGLTDQIAVQREWSISPLASQGLVDSLRVGPDLNSLQDVLPTDRAVVHSFIRSVHFRYIPNHVRPADLIRTETEPLRTALLMRLGRTKAYKRSGVGDAMKRLTEVANDMLAATSSKISIGNLGRGIGADVPAEFSELAFQVALHTRTAFGLELTELQGSGSQSFTLLHILDLLDRAESGQSFGWKKANIWALEEPESFLHAGLRARFAHDAAQYATDVKRQVLVTTHHEEFVRVADDAWLAEIANSQSSVSRLDSRTALTAASQRRISAYQHPLMEFPDYPIVLVEGKFDGVHLRAAVAEAGLRPRWKLVVMAEADSTYKPGGTALGTYLSANKAVINSRPLSGPVIVLRDWEDAGAAKNQFSNPLSGHSTSTLLCCDPSLVNDQLGSSFRGIERFLPTSLVTSVIPPVHLTRPAADDYPLDLTSAGKDAYKSSYKKILADLVTNGQSPGPAMISLVEWLDANVVAALSSVPASAFL